MRYRRLGEGHRAYLRSLPPAKRLREWAWLHLQFKFAPWALLRIGRRRVLAFLKDADYAEYLGKLEADRPASRAFAPPPDGNLRYGGVVMQRMFDPKTIAVIGASETEGSVGRTIMENAMASAGRTVYPINPKHPTILGLPTHAAIGDIAEEIDLAMVATPAATVPDVLAQCAAAGVHGAIVVSAGFSETGEKGAALETQIRDILRDSPMRVVGPNCLGVIRPTVGLNASFLRINPEPGNIALISQSGALGTGMLDWAIDAHIGFSMFASVGGMVDIDFADLVDFLGEDEHTRAILIYMESIGNARRFMSAARGFARNKPIIVLKPGRYAESAKAALSHTGSMAGGDEVYEAAFRREGVVRVHEVAGSVPRGGGSRLEAPAPGPRRRDRHQRRRSGRHGDRRDRGVRRTARMSVGSHDGEAERVASAVLEPRQPRRRAGRRGFRALRRRSPGVPRRRRRSTASCSSTRRRATRAPTRWPRRWPLSSRARTSRSSPC